MHALLVGERDMADMGRVDDRLQRGAIVMGALRDTAHAGALRAGEIPGGGFVHGLTPE